MHKCKCTTITSTTTTVSTTTTFSIEYFTCNKNVFYCSKSVKHINKYLSIINADDTQTEIDKAEKGKKKSVFFYIRNIYVKSNVKLYICNCKLWFYISQKDVTILTV